VIEARVRDILITFYLPIILNKCMNNLFFQTTPLIPALTDDPFLSIECDEASATTVQPMYPFRLVACASKLTELSIEMFTQCHAITDIQVSKLLCAILL
jgi:hypothetical protein